MDVKEAIEKRRAYRSLEPIEISDDIVRELAHSAGLAASCFNHQPWNFVFVREPDMIDKMKDGLSKGNEWAHSASMMIAVFSKKDDDCVIKDREYYLFDTGMATANLILRATELGLVAHPIAGFSPEKTRAILRIPEEMNVIALIIVGKKSDHISRLTDHQVQAEKERPERQSLEEYVHMNTYKQRNLQE